MSLQVRDTKVLFDNLASIKSHGCQIKRVLLYPLISWKISLKITRLKAERMTNNITMELTKIM